jgi:putative ABC transport system permease protein
MFKNDFLTAIRTLRRNKNYTVINVVGLSLGIACAILIFLLIKYNLSFDNFHQSPERIYRITTELSIGKKKYIPGVPSPLAAAFRNDYSFAEKVAMIYNSRNELVTVEGNAGPQKFEENVAFAEPSFFEIFNFPLLEGNAQSLLRKPNSAIITQRIAKKYFGNDNPIGKTFKISNKADFTVAAVMKNLRANTERRQEIYVPFRDLKALQPWLVNDFWMNVNDNMQCFIRLRPGVSIQEVNNTFPAFIHKYYNDKDAPIWKFRLQPLSDIHLNTNFGALMSEGSLFALACIGLFIVCAACINFVNLATAQAIGRSKEIGLRKVLGSSQSQLFWQFIVETAVIALIAMLLAMVIVEMALPFVNQLFETQLNFRLLDDFYLSAFLTVLFIFMVFSSGFYPGLVLAGIQPVLALKGQVSHKISGSMPLRKALVITQFAISQLLIIGTIVIVNQMRYSQKADMGFVKDGIVMLPVPDNKALKINTLKSQFLSLPGVKGLSFCYAAPAYENANTTSIQFGSRTEPEKFQVSFRAADKDYAALFGLSIIAGRNVLPSDTVREFLVNQSTVKMLGFKSDDAVLGHKVDVNGYKGLIVGVMRDFHNNSLHTAIEPLVLTTFNVWYEHCFIKIDLQNMKQTLSKISDIWKSAYPNHLYKQEFLDDRIAGWYETDNRMMKLIQVFTFIAVFIGCLSLYGLVSFMAAQKRREVAVRKVLGAKIESIVFLFLKEFGRLMLIAFALSAPLGWWVMNKWLQNFAYRIDIGAGIFLMTLLITFGIVTLTVGYRSLKVAMADPAKALRSE